jgi:hypothetical protein
MKRQNIRGSPIGLWDGTAPWLATIAMCYVVALLLVSQFKTSAVSLSISLTKLSRFGVSEWPNRQSVKYITYPAAKKAPKFRDMTTL